MLSFSPGRLSSRVRELYTGRVVSISLLFASLGMQSKVDRAGGPYEDLLSGERLVVRVVGHGVW